MTMSTPPQTSPTTNPPSTNTTTTTKSTTDKHQQQNDPIKSQPQTQNQDPGSKNQLLDRSTDDPNDVILSQLQSLQSPPPKLDLFDENHRDSPISQVCKPNSTTITSTTPPIPRHRGFLSQLLCCFRPSQSNVYSNSKQNSNNIITTKNIYGKSNQTNSEKTNANQHQNENNLHHPQNYSGKYLLPARKNSDNRICLVIDLDETLVHSSFKAIDNPDFIVPVEIFGTIHDVYVLKRPHVDEFLKRVGSLFECVLFTASLAKYADPVADLLDKENIFKARLFRESCAFYRGNYVKDLSRLGRDLDRVIILDNSPASYIFHPDNALPVTSYFDDKNDDQLLNLIPELEKLAAKTGPVVPITLCYNN